MERTITVGLALLILMSAVPLRADDHLIPLAAVQSRMSEAASRRDHDLADVKSLLTSAEGGEAAALVGVDDQLWSARTASLSDEELHGLALRAALLRTDPVAGGTVKVLIIVVIVLVVLSIIALSTCHDPGFGCTL